MYEQRIVPGIPEQEKGWQCQIDTGKKEKEMTKINGKGRTNSLQEGDKKGRNSKRRRGVSRGLLKKDCPDLDQ